MTEGYEALRSQATGEGVVSVTPRGLTLLLRSGLAAWMAVWRPRVVCATPPIGARTGRLVTAVRLGPELAVLLVEMALAGQRGQRRNTS